MKDCDVLARCKKDRPLMRRIRERQLKFVDHIIKEDSIEKSAVEGKVDRKEHRE